MSQRSIEFVRGRDEFRIEGHATLERILLQRSLAESMDREDGRFIEFLKRPTKRIAPPVSFPAAPGFEGQRPKVGIDIRPLLRFSRSDHLPDPLAHAFPEFGRRRLRIGHDEDLARKQVVFDEHPDVERGQRVGLARSGAGFDERRSAQHELPGIEVHHSRSTSRARKKGSKNSSASSSKLNRTGNGAGVSSGDAPSQTRAISRSSSISGIMKLTVSPPKNV